MGIIIHITYGRYDGEVNRICKAPGMGGLLCHLRAYIIIGPHTCQRLPQEASTANRETKILKAQIRFNSYLRKKKLRSLFLTLTVVPSDQSIGPWTEGSWD